jgi:alcohol dehydrogenase (NADP+)
MCTFFIDPRWPFGIKKGTSLFHADNYAPFDIPATWATMEKLYDAGKVRAIGVCNFSTKKTGGFDCCSSCASSL